MLPRPMRTLVSVLATLGLIGALTAIPVAAESDGRPAWAPGPPPWVFELFERLGASGVFPFDGFPGAIGEERSEAGADNGQAAGDAREEAGPPAGLTLPPQAGSGDDESEGGETDAGPPAWVPPAEAPPAWVPPAEGPPAWVPAGRP